MVKNPFALLRSALGTISLHPVVLFPFCLMGFVQLLILELLFFAPREPLASFFGPLIHRFADDIYLHYPYNFVLLERWYSSGNLQIPVFVLLNSFLIGSVIVIIHAINEHQKVRISQIFRRTLGRYVHLVMASVILVGVLYGLSHGYGLLIQRAAQIRSTTGHFFLIKQFVIQGWPYVKLLISCLTTTLLAFTFPLIVLERKNVFSAFFLNFARYYKAFGTIFAVILLSSLLYVPILLLKTYRQWYESIMIPELWVVIPVMGMIVMLFVDALQVAAVTTYYLFDREASQ